MKITKFPQSCILVESNKTKILIDPGTVKYDEKFLKIWKTADAILVTHKHGDHIHAQALENLNLSIYSTREVANAYPNLKINLIKENDCFKIGNIKINVVKAIHGYTFSSGAIYENVGFVLDDGKTKLYITSDTVGFKTDLKVDVIFADVTAFDVSLNLWGITQMKEQVGAKLLVVAHQDAGKMMYEKSQIENYLNEQKVNYIIPEILETFEV